MATPLVHVTLGEIVGLGQAAATDSAAWDQLAESGAAWRRTETPWARYDPTGAGTPDADQVALWQAAYADARARGLKTIHLLDYGNPPAGFPYRDFGRDITEEEATLFANAYAVPIVALFGTDGIIYELWNEAQWDFESLDNYAMFAKVVCAAIKAAHPDAKIAVGGGLAWNPNEDYWGSNPLAKSPATRAFCAIPGVFDDADYLSLHCYRNAVPETLVEDIQLLLDDETVTVPILLTEWAYNHDGWSVAVPTNGSHGNPYLGYPPTQNWTSVAVTEAMQSAYAVRMMLVAAAVGFPVQTWFTIQDFTVAEGGALTWGLVRADGTPKAGYDYLQFMGARFADYAWAETLSSGAVWAMRFTADGLPDVVAAWTMYSFDAGTYDVPVGGAAYSADGTLLATSGSVDLSEAPVWIVADPTPTITPWSGRIAAVTFPAGATDKTVRVGDGDSRPVATDVAYISGLAPGSTYDATATYTVDGQQRTVPLIVETDPDAATASPCGLGESVLTAWGANRAANDTKGLNDAAPVPTGDFAGLIEEHTTEHHVLMGGEVATKSCTVYTDDPTAGHLMVGDWMVTDEGKVWRVTSIPVQPEKGGHWELEGEWVSRPPMEVLPWI